MRTVISYPKFLAKAMKAKVHNELRLFYAIKMIDEDGRGKHTESELKEFFCSGGNNHLFSPKRLKGILHSGNGVFWTYYPDKALIYHYSPKKVAENLECETVGNHQVIVYPDFVFCSIKTFKAFCHKAFLASTKESPISRNKLESIIGVSDDTMRSYESDVRTKNNYILLCEGYDPDSAQYQEYIWQYGLCVRIVHEGKVYTGVRKANSYLSPIELVNMGKTARKAINNHLASIYRKTGNIVNKVFYSYQTKGCQRGDYLLVDSKFGGKMKSPTKLGVSNLWTVV